MLNWTLAEIRTKVQNDLDLIDEDFITTDELDAYINEGIDLAEAEIHTIYENKNQHYFLSVADIDLVTGTSDYEFPTDVYANKIRRLIYDDGSRKYMVRVIKNLDELPLVESTEDYRCVIFNITGVGPRIRLFPASRETDSTGKLKIYYLRNANRLVDDTDECDIPEAANYVIQYAKEQCLAKENGGVSPPGAISKTNMFKQLMVESLTEMVPDEDNLIDPDTSFYEDFSFPFER